MGKPVLCLDFDGVLHSYASGWKGADVIPDAPVPGMTSFLHTASVHFEVHIFSSRSNQPGGVEAMQAWLLHHLQESFGELPGAQALFDSIQFPKEKPSALVTLDDRAITFTGEWPSLKTLLEFKPWNKRGEVHA